MTELAMRLFFFGSLMDSDLLSVVLDRPLDGVASRPARLLGFDRRRARGESFPVIVRQPGGAVDGSLVDGLSWGDLDRVQYFEGEDYRLRPFPVAADDTRIEAHMFIATEKLRPDEASWDFERWRLEEKPFALAVAVELMASYGTLSAAEIGPHWPAMVERAWARVRDAKPLPQRRRVRS
ncbi:MAG: gamma-glutamylcyclotransferase family protein [Dongiaceae bacterium]